MLQSPLQPAGDGAAAETVEVPAEAVEAPSAEPVALLTPPPGSLRALAARGTLINTAFTAALGGLSLLGSFILAGFVSRADYGVWGVLMVTLGTLLWLKQVGVGDKYVQQREPDQELAFQKAFTLELLFSCLLVVLLAAAVPVVVAVYNLPKLVAPSLVVGFTILVSVFQAPLWIYYRQMRFFRQRMLTAVSPVVSFGVSIGLAAGGAGYWAFVGGLAAGATAASVAAVIGSPFKLRLRYEAGTMRSYASFSIPLLIASGAAFVMTWSALISAKLELGVAAVGVIVLASTISSFTDSVDQLVTGALYPAICAVRERTELLYESFVKSNRLALMWAVPFGVGLTLFAPDLVRFGIGERWHPSIVVLQVFGVAAAINHVGFNWTAYFRARGQTRPIALANLVAMCVFLAVGIPLLLTLGLRGFALGIAAQSTAALLVRGFYLQQMFAGFAFVRHAARAFLPTVPAAGAVLLLRAAEQGNRTLGDAVIELAVYLVVTVAATWYLESKLLREALAILRARPPAPALS